MFDLQNIKKTYFKMATPVVIGLVITVVYNIVDTLFITMTGDQNIIAGVAYCGPLFTLLMAFGNIFGQGGSSLVARLFGKNETDGIKRISSFCFYGAIITSVIIMALMLIFRTQFLGILGAKPEDASYSHASDYYTWLAIGAPAIIVSFIHGNLIRCEGHANQAMIGHLIGTAVNIILDPILILVFKMGAAGAAIATASGFLCTIIYQLFAVIFKSKFISLNPKYIVCKGKYVLSILGIGLTVAITNFMQTFSNTFLNNYLNLYIVDGQPNPVAAMGVVLKITLILQLVISGFSFGGTPVFGYLFGMNDKKKIKELLKFIVLLLTGVSLGIGTLLIVLSKPICSVFFSGDPQTIAMASTILRWLCAGSAFMALVFITTMLFQASGKTIPALIMSVTRQGIIFALALISLNALFGYTGVLATQFVADVISLIIGAITAFITFRKFFKEEKEVVAN